MNFFNSIPLRDWFARPKDAVRASSAAQRRRRLAASLGGKRRSQLEKLETRHLLAAVSGEVYLDANQDGLRQTGETGAADVRVYLDQNGNGRLDPTEFSTTTDIDGNYSFPTLASGDYEIRLAPAPGFVQTAPSLTLGWNDTVVQDNAGEYFRAAQLFQVDASGTVESIGQPTRNRMDGLVQIGDNSLIGIDTRSNEVFRVDPYTGERSRIAEANLDIVGGLAYDRVGNTVYTLVRGSTDPTNRTLARLDTNTARVSLIGAGYSGLNTVTDLEFDPINRRLIGFDNNDDEFFAFDLNGVGRTLSRAGVTVIDPLTGLPVQSKSIDGNSMSLATTSQLVGVLPGGPVATSTYVWMFDADDTDRVSTLLVEIPDAVPNLVEAAIVRPSIDVSEAVRAVALTRSAIGNNPQNVSLTSFETRSNVDFAIAPDVIGFRAIPSKPLFGPGSLSQAGVTVVGGAIGADFVEITLNRQPTSNVTLNLSISSNVGGDPGVVLDVDRLTFTPQDWDVPRRVMLSPNLDNPVKVITPSTLTVGVDAPTSDVLWRTLPLQTLPVRTLPPLDENKFTNPVISEVLIEGRFTSGVSRVSDQYIELRGQPNEVLPAGTYFVVIEEWASRTGLINAVIDLSGQQFGGNGFLVLLQGGNSYEPAFGANVLESDSSGFNGLPGGIFSGSDANGSLESIFSNGAYFLIQSDAAPVVGLDLDTNNDGFFDPTSAAANWTTYDSIAMHDFSFFDSTYASIVFVESFSNNHPTVTRNSRGQTVVASDGYGYVGRIGDSIGSDYEDWVYGTVDEVEAGFWGGESDPPGFFELYENESSYPALFDHALDHIGESNFVGGVRGLIALLPSNGDILNGVPADTRLPAEGVTVFVDTNGNGRRDSLVHVVEPDDAAPPFDINNPVPNDAEYPVTQIYDGVTITWDQAGGAFVSDDIVSRRQRVNNRAIGNRVFTAGPFDYFYSSSRLRFDFHRPISSASIDVLNARSTGLVYGRLDAYNAAGQLVATSVSSAVSGSRRGTVSVSAPGEQIVRIEAYGDDNFNTFSFYTNFDTMSYVQSEPSAVTDQNGIYEISGLFPGQYNLSIASTSEVANLLETATRPFEITKYENFFFESEFRPNSVPTFSGSGDVEFTIDENPPVGSVIATVDAFDADNAGLQYEFVGGDSTGLELIQRPDFTAEIRVTEAAVLNFEAEPQRILTVRATDELGASATVRIVLNLTDINEAPEVSDAELAVPEGAIAGPTTGTVIGRIDAVDPDTSSTQMLTYTVIPSTTEDFFERDASSYFSVDELTGVVRLIAPLDFETLSFLVLRVQIDDNITTVGQNRGIAIVDKIIRISDENDPPQIPTTVFDVSESATGELFALSVFDPDEGQTHVFELVNGSSRFTLTPTGKLFLNPGQTLDYEAGAEIKFDVLVSDNGAPSLSTTQTITINLSNVDEPAVLSRNNNQNTPTSENETGLLVATLSLVDPEGLHSDYAFELLPGPGADLFSFNPISGELKVANGAVLDYEAATFHDLSFEIFDRTGQIPTTTQPFRVFVSDVNEPASVLTSKLFVSEVPQPGDEIGRIRAVDPDPGFAGSQLSIQLVGGTAQRFFEFESLANAPGKTVEQIDPFLLKIRGDFNLAEFRALDASDLNLLVQVSDGNSTTAGEIQIDIELNEVNERPEFNASVLANTFDNLQITTGTTFRLSIPENIAADPEGEQFLIRVGQKVRDAEGNLVLDQAGRVQLELPAWLTYNEVTRELVGRPSGAIQGQFELVVRALEIGPFPLSSDYEFALDVNARQNPTNPYDVNNDGQVTSLDALRIINFAAFDEGLVAQAGGLSDSLVYLDVSGDGRVTLVDAVQVINELNRIADTNLGIGIQGSSEPLSSSDVEGSWLSEDQRRRERAVDALLSESLLF